MTRVQAIRRLLWNPLVPYHARRTLPLVSSLDRKKKIIPHSQTYLFYYYFPSLYIRLSWSPIFSDFPTTILNTSCVLSVSSCLIWFPNNPDEDCKLRHSLLRSFHQSHIFHLSWIQRFSSTVFLSNPNSLFFQYDKRPNFTEEITNLSYPVNIGWKDNFNIFKIFKRLLFPP
jgi:hypothetical protein